MCEIVVDYMSLQWLITIFINIIVYLLDLKALRFGDVELAGKLNYADLWWEATENITKLILDQTMQ